MKRIFLFLFSILFINNLYFAQSTTGLDIKVGSAIPLLKFSDLYNANLSATAGVILPFSEDMQFIISSGYLRWDLNNSKFNSKNAGKNGYDYFEFEAPINAIPLLLSFRYRLTESKVIPYLAADFGFYYFTQKLTGNYSQNGNVYPAPPVENNGFSTMLALGFGLTYKLGNNYYLDFTSKFNGAANADRVSSSGSGGDVNTSSNTTYFLSAMIGINYYFTEQ
jgi:hypothetical protein